MVVVELLYTGLADFYTLFVCLVDMRSMRIGRKYFTPLSDYGVYIKKKLLSTVTLVYIIYVKVQLQKTTFHTYIILEVVF